MPAPEIGRLDSWKEIAAYLGRSVRTVQRWEREEGLPVRRRTEDEASRRQVFAFPEELDEWWRTRGEPAHSHEASPDRRRIVWAAVAAAALVLIPVWLLSRSPDRDLPASAPRLVATLPAQVTRLSPDGKLLAYTHRDTDKLWLFDFDTVRSKLLVDAPVHPGVHWNPDGRRILFLEQGERDHILQVLDLHTGERNVIWEGPPDVDRVGLQQWSADGAEVTFLIVYRDETPDTEATVRVEKPDNGAAVLAVPRFEAYVAKSENPNDVYLRPVAGNAPAIQITHTDRWKMFPFLAPDQSKVLYVLRGDGRIGSEANLWATPIDPISRLPHGEPEFVARLGGRERQSFVGTTADGSVRYGVVVLQEQVHAIRVDPESGAVLGEAKQKFERGSYSFHWAADSPVLYYQSHQYWDYSGDSQLDRMARDFRTGTERVVSLPRWPDRPKGLDPRTDAVSPDLSRMALWSGSFGDRTLWVYDVDTDRARKVWEGPAVYGRAAFSRDGKRLTAWSLWKEKGPQLSVFDTDGIEPPRTVAVLRRGAISSEANWAPDGHEIAFNDRNCLKIAFLDGRQPQELTCAEPPPAEEAELYHLTMRFWFGASPTWSPSGKKIAWPVADPAKRRTDLWIVDRDSGEHFVAWSGEPDYAVIPTFPKWSPDGRWIAFTKRFQEEREIWEWPGLLSQAMGEPTDQKSAVAAR